MIIMRGAMGVVFVKALLNAKRQLFTPQQALWMGTITEKTCLVFLGGGHISHLWEI